MSRGYDTSVSPPPPPSSRRYDTGSLRNRHPRNAATFGLTGVGAWKL